LFGITAGGGVVAGGVVFGGEVYTGGGVVWGLAFAVVGVCVGFFVEMGVETGEVAEVLVVFAFEEVLEVF
jgi:hypothetical protein